MMSEEDDDDESTESYYPMGTFKMRDIAMHSSWLARRGLDDGAKKVEEQVA